MEQGGRIFIGVDGGGSGCRAALVQGTARRGQAEGAPANVALDPPGAARALMDVVAAAYRAAVGQAPDEGDLAETPILMGLAGLNAPGAEAALRAALPYRRLRLLSDAVTSAEGALGGQDGIVVALGTGSVLARRHLGGFHQIGGWGPALGDEGGGAWIGRRALSAALAAFEGHGPASPFLTALLQTEGGAGAIIAFALSARSADFAARAPQVVAAAAQGDPGAEAILAEGAAYLHRAIAALQPPQGPRLPVAFTGKLGPSFALRLAAQWRQCPAQGDALEGALRLAAAFADEKGAP